MYVFTHVYLWVCLCVCVCVCMHHLCVLEWGHRACVGARPWNIIKANISPVTQKEGPAPETRETSLGSERAKDRISWTMISGGICTSYAHKIGPITGIVGRGGHQRPCSLLVPQELVFFSPRTYWHWIKKIVPQSEPGGPAQWTNGAWGLVLIWPGHWEILNLNGKTSWPAFQSPALCPLAQPQRADSHLLREGIGCMELPGNTSAPSSGEMSPLHTASQSGFTLPLQLEFHFRGDVSFCHLIWWQIKVIYREQACI